MSSETFEPRVACDDAALHALALCLADAAIAARCTVATAESCTGGWIAKTLTDLAGSSAWFGTGLVTYSNDAKHRLLDVPQASLQAHGAVSEATARAMVAGALACGGAGLAVAVTGIAGPGGGSIEKPVGTVWIAWQRRGAPAHTRHFHFDGDREAVRRQAVAKALDGLLQSLTADSARADRAT